MEPLQNLTISAECKQILRNIGNYLLRLGSNFTLTSSSTLSRHDLHNWSRRHNLTSASATLSTSEENQKNALFFIVIVLSFYAFGIGFMMIKYMRKEEKDFNESKLYRSYVNAAQDQYRKTRNKALLTNRLALQALNTINAIQQTTDIGPKVTFV